MELLPDPGRDEFAQRLNRVLAGMEAEGLQGLAVYSPAWRKEEVRYLTNYLMLGPYALALLSNSGQMTLFTSQPWDVGRALETAWAEDIRPAGANFSSVVSRLTEVGIKGQLGISGFSLAPHGLFQAIAGRFPGLKIMETNLLARLRLKKSSWELVRLEKAAALADEAYQVFCQVASHRPREYELVAEVERLIKARGGEDNFMLIASGSDLHTMRPPTSRVLQAGDTVITEVTPQYQGYWAQVCRTLILGQPTPEQEKAFDIFLRAQEAGLKAARPGASASDVAKAQNDVFRQEGFGEYTTSKYTRVRGHGQGLHLDEEPMIEEGNSLLLEPGMVMVIHPNTYLPLAGYMVQGDTVVITEEGYRLLSQTPRRLFVG